MVDVNDPNYTPFDFVDEIEHKLPPIEKTSYGPNTPTQYTYPVSKIYNTSGTLLYVSRSVQFQQLIDKPWFKGHPVTIKVEWYYTSGKAEDAKAVCIDKENPLWNKRRL